MSNQKILIDTGPIVAVLSRDDAHHASCVAQLEQLRPPLYTCWPVVTEVLWLVRRRPAAVDAFFRAFEAGLFKLLPMDEQALPALSRFVARYRKIGAQLADVALLHLAGREGIRTVFTLDRRDFAVYRIHRNRALNVIPAST